MQLGTSEPSHTISFRVLTTPRQMQRTTATKVVRMEEHIAHFMN